MKFRNIFTTLAALSIILTSCADVDEPIYNAGVGVAQLVVKGIPVEIANAEYTSIVNNETGTIVVQVPYYVSDTERIMADLTQFKLEAQMPTGYMFQPSLTGIHNLVEGYRTNLIDTKGNARPFVITAEYVKSSESLITAGKLIENERIPVAIKQPETVGEHGKIIIVKTSSSIEGALSAVELSISAWATIECDAYNAETGTFDFTNNPSVTIVAQDGVTSITYDVEIQLPALKDMGVGYIAAMWAKQLCKGNDEGWEENANSSLAVVDNYLIVGNANDFTKMLVFDRFNGKRLNNVAVNTDGIPAGRKIRCIANDDANHLVAGVFTSNSWEITDPTVFVYVWKDGIGNKPTPVLEANIKGGYFTGVSGTNAIDVFVSMSVSGNMVSGNGVISNVYRGHYGGVMIMPFVDGKPNGNCIYEGNAGTYGSTWDSSNAKMLTTQAPWSYCIHSGNGRGVVSYIPEGTGNRAITFKRPLNHWWGNSQTTSDWCGTTRALDVIDFNGCRLVGILNGVGTADVKSYRLYVADLTTNPTETALQTGFIFDSREGDAKGVATAGGPAGTGYCNTGMISYYTFDQYEGQAILGNNFFAPVNRELGNVIFARSADGNAVQVYALVQDMGIMSYEITRYDL